MISEVTWERTTWAALPHKFEAGTPPIAGALGLAAALRYVKSLGFSEIIEHEHQILEYARTQLSNIPGITIYGRPVQQAPILSFNLHGAHASDVGALLDQQGIAIRTGHHCCQPLMRRLGVSGTARASFSIYNTKQEVDVLREGLLKAQGIFS